MSAAKRNDPEVLTGANPETDCQGQPIDSNSKDQPSELASPPSSTNSNVAIDHTEGEDDEEETPQHVTWLNVPTPRRAGDPGLLSSWQPLRGRWSILLEKVALLIEQPINKITSTQYNPLYYTGTIAFFLLVIVGLTGLYLFFFFQYGFDASYRAVSVMESQFIARTIRAGHRYASGALVIVTLLHAYRTLFLEKFRGPRWLAWVTGIVLTSLIWIAGITGYWLIWDERALLITETFRRALDQLTSWTPGFMVFLLGAGESGRSWILFLVLIAAHILLFLIALAFFYLHIRRLKRPKWFPPVHWVAGISIILLLGALFFPVGMLPQANLSQLPQAISFDPIFLFFLPFPGATWLWLGLMAVTVTLAALPWLSRGRKRQQTAADDRITTPSYENLKNRANHALLPEPVHIIKERCTGCTKCALDCPYGAIEMVERHDGKPQKYIALEKADLCVSCGICLGSCDALAVTLGDVMPETLWGVVSEQISQSPIVDSGVDLPIDLPSLDSNLINEHIKGAEVVYTCERHALHGARPYLENSTKSGNGEGVVVIPLPCVGAAPPDLLSRTMDAGARSVSVVGCPPDDCAGREGNLWTSQRLARQRVPRLRRGYEDMPITAAWLPPNAFADAFQQKVRITESGVQDYQATRRLYGDFNWRKFLPALLLLGAVLLVQILLTDLPLRPVNSGQSVVQLAEADLGLAFGNLTTEQAADKSFRLSFLIDGVEAYSRTLTADELLGQTWDIQRPFFYQLPLEPGEYEFSLQLVGDTGSEHLLFKEGATITPGQIWRPSLDSFSTPVCSPQLHYSCPE